MNQLKLSKLKKLENKFVKKKIDIKKNNLKDLKKWVFPLMKLKKE